MTKIRNKLEEIIDTDKATHESWDDVFTRLNKEGRLDFRAVFRMLAAVLDALDEGVKIQIDPMPKSAPLAVKEEKKAKPAMPTPPPPPPSTNPKEDPKKKKKKPIIESIPRGDLNNPL